jgi:general secretion pathway protein C
MNQSNFSPSQIGPANSAFSKERALQKYVAATLLKESTGKTRLWSMNRFQAFEIDHMFYATIFEMGLFSNSRFFSSLKNSDQRPPFEAFYVYILAIVTGFFIADLSTVYVRPAMLPSRALPPRPSLSQRPHFVDISQYAPVTQRNIFNADGVIPPALTIEGGGDSNGPDNTLPVLSQLPFKLEGTLVHANPKKSVATISATKGNENHAYSVDNEIEGMARVTRIERRKVIFRNLNNQRLEYIEIPKDSAVSFGVKDPVVTGSEEVQKKGEFEFTMNRGDLTKYTSNLGSILNQAAMVPNVIPGSGGRVEGFRFVSIQPGSIYEKLGFKPMDVIKTVNGEPINSPTKAMELYNALKTEKNITMSVNRDGKDEDFRYNIND